MKSRIRMLLEILMKQEQGMSIYDLSLNLEVSEKTIREDISSYMQCSKDLLCEIQEQHGNYTVKTKQNLHDLTDAFQEIDMIFGTNEMRELMMLRKLLLANQYVKLETFMDDLYISLPTVHRIFKKVKAILSSYHLSVQVKPNYGVKIIGDEVNKRLCYAHNLSDIDNNNIQEIATQCAMTSEDYYFIDYVIRKSLDTCNFDLTETGIKNLIVHIMYAICRMKQGNYIENMQLHYAISEKETEIAFMMIEELEKAFSLKFPDTEIDYIRIHLLSKRANHESESCLEISKRSEDILFAINKEIKRHLGFDFQQNLELMKMLALHIEPMLSRIEYGIHIPNPALVEIKAKFPNAYECAVIAANYIEEHFGFTVSDDELGYLSLHYHLAIQNYHEHKKYLVVCGSGGGTARLLQQKLMYRYHIQKEDLILCGLRSLKDMDLTPYDAIISTVSIPFSLHKQIIYIKDILTDITLSSKKESSELKKRLNPELFLLKQSFQSREEVINALCEHITKVLDIQEDLVSLIWKRETLSSTDIGNYVAIPHPYTRCHMQSFIAVCTLKKAIFWKNHKVKYIFLISFSEEDMIMSHDINEELMKKLLDTEWINTLDKVQSREELLELF